MRKIGYIVIILAVIWFGFTLGRSTGQDDTMEAERDLRTDFPLPPPPPTELEQAEDGDADEEEHLIVMELPVDGAQVGHTFEVSGRVHPSIRSLDVVIEDGSGEQLIVDRISTSGGTAESFGRFDYTVEIDVLYEGGLKVRINGLSARQDIYVERDVFVVPEDSIGFNVYFANTGLAEEHDGPYDICTVVHPVKRTASTRSNIYLAAIEALTKGPTDAEVRDGYTTSLPKNVVIRSAVADADGIVTVDFTRSVQSGVAGSCRVQAIRAQISETLEQFPEVRGVKITVDGDEDEALQP